MISLTILRTSFGGWFASAVWDKAGRGGSGVQLQDRVRGSAFDTRSKLCGEVNVTANAERSAKAATGG
jgi:hypothetical protein